MALTNSHKITEPDKYKTSFKADPGLCKTEERSNGLTQPKKEFMFYLNLDNNGEKNKCK